jgi:hypothetical protein
MKTIAGIPRGFFSPRRLRLSAVDIVVSMVTSGWHNTGIGSGLLRRTWLAMMFAIIAEEVTCDHVCIEFRVS